MALAEANKTHWSRQPARPALGEQLLLLSLDDESGTSKESAKVVLRRLWRFARHLCSAPPLSYVRTTGPWALGVRGWGTLRCAERS